MDPMADSARRALGDMWVAGYNAALVEAADKVKNLRATNTSDFLEIAKAILAMRRNLTD